MIPKIIHYCWFGGNPLPPLAVKCIESWRKHCPDYEIKEWNESNFDINFNIYTKEAYELKKWAFVSDVARLHVIYNQGGVYLDTDVEVIKPLDRLLSESMFAGFESSKFIATGLGFGAEKNFHLVAKMLDAYSKIPFIMDDGELNTTPCPTYNTEVIKQEGFIIDNTKQTIKNVTLYPTEYFCPKDYLTGKVRITPNTFTIHHFNASWKSNEKRNEDRKRQWLIKVFGFKRGVNLHNALYIFKIAGINGVVTKIKESKKED